MNYLMEEYTNCCYKFAIKMENETRKIITFHNQISRLSAPRQTRRQLWKRKRSLVMSSICSGILYVCPCLHKLAVDWGDITTHISQTTPSTISPLQTQDLVSITVALVSNLFTLTTIQKKQKKLPTSASLT
jgi:hypothetical protein